MPPAVRTFIAIETPADKLAALGGLIASLRQSGVDARWETGDKMHCTVKFLGDVEGADLGDVLSIIRSTVGRYPKFTLVYEGIGAFPNARRPRVIWAGCSDRDGVLGRLKTGLDDALGPKGFPAEDRAFHPHVTLGRMNSDSVPGNLTPKLENLTFEPRIIQVDTIVVMKSVLRPQGALYTRLDEIQLRQQSDA